jgi:DNA-binding NarL/FixJ family response regulator
MDKIRIIVAEDHELVRKGTCHILAQYPDFEIPDEATDGEQTLIKYIQGS